MQSSQIRQVQDEYNIYEIIKTYAQVYELPQNHFGDIWKASFRSYKHFGWVENKSNIRFK